MERSFQKTRSLVTPTGLDLVRVFTGDDGASHLEDVHYSMAKTRHGLIAENVQVTEISLYSAETAAGPGAFAPAPCRQLVIPLAGSVEVEASDGQRRTLGVGTILLAEDTSGKGHRLHDVQVPRLLLVAPLQDKKRAPSGLLW